MSHPSVIAVYGLPGVDREARAPAETAAPPRFARLGSGRLVGERLVIVDQELATALSGDRPPRPRLVGIAARRDGRPFVEVVEVLQVVGSSVTDQWCAELATPAESPVDPDSGLPGIPDGGGPANGFCFFFPGLSFC